MPNAFIFSHQSSGDTLYFQVRNDSAELWSTAGAAFETYAPGNWANYAIALTEQGSSGVYTGTFPDPVAGDYNTIVFVQTGPSPAEGDPRAGGAGAGYDGTNLVGPYTLHALLAAIKAVTDALPDGGALNDLAAVREDTDELQTDWTEGGRLDLLLDSALEDTDEIQAGLADGGRVDLLIDSIKAVTDALPDGGALSALAAVLEDTGTTLPALLADIAGYLDTEVAAILLDTDEIQAGLADGGRVDLLIDSIKAVTDALPDGGALSDLAAVLADTHELQTDWADGGRLDLLLDGTGAAVGSALWAKTLIGALTFETSMQMILAAVAGDATRTLPFPITYDHFAPGAAGGTRVFESVTQPDQTGRAVTIGP